MKKIILQLIILIAFSCSDTNVVELESQSESTPNFVNTSA
jgi:hypothetical protein